MEFLVNKKNSVKMSGWKKMQLKYEEKNFRAFCESCKDTYCIDNNFSSMNKKAAKVCQTLFDDYKHTHTGSYTDMILCRVPKFALISNAPFTVRSGKDSKSASTLRSTDLS